MTPIQALDYAIQDAAGVDPRNPLSVVLWRRAYALSLGFDVLSAATIAEERAIDLHELERLTARGCPPRTALAIVR